MMINLRKIIVSAVTVLAVSLNLSAEEKLYVEYNDGSVFSYVLENKPKVTFAGNVISVSAPEIADTHKMGDVKLFRFDKMSSVKEIEADERRITFTDNETVRLDGFKAGGTVSVYDVRGTLNGVSAVGDDGTAVVTLGQLAPGIYIIATTEGKSYKIIKR